MGSALETLCGQAYGAGQLEMLGIYIQRSWLILFTTAMPLILLYIFATPILKLIGQDPKISDWTGKFAIWMIPTVFSFAMNFPIQKYLQAQSKIYVMATISGVVLLLHIFFAWIFMIKLGWGLAGAAVVENTSWWLIVVAQLMYIFSGACGEAWPGFSWKAFESLRGFVRLSLASALMVCLEYWYFVAVILCAGYLKNAEIAIDALSICMNIVDWTVMIAYGFNAAISVRVSNELGAGHPRAARFSVLVVLVTAFLFSTFFASILMTFRKQFPLLFSNSEEVQQIVYEFTPLLAFTIVLNNVQPAISGVAIGAGWQVYVALVNIVCYYLFGIPVGLILCYVFDMGIKGIWYGMLCGTIVETIVLLRLVYRTNWSKEVSLAEDRVKEWGGDY
ncbi:hypothetical protein Leryth_018595 [Lithospermum erythrorhizon]|nr:hypothetical protein Leryth_018595 [Lithospermum erythrorhizon]